MDKKEPTKCNHCNSTDIAKQVWGRLEFWFCRSCRQEPVYVEPEIAPTLWTGATWNPKDYGLSSVGDPDHIVKNVDFDWGFYSSTEDGNGD